MLSRRLLCPRRRRRGAILFAAALGLAITATYVAQGWAVARARPRARRRRPRGGARCADALRRGPGAHGSSNAATALLPTPRAVKDHPPPALRQLLRLGPAYTSTSRTGTIQTTIVDAVDRLDRYVAAFLPQTLSAIIGAAAIAVALVVLDPVVGLIVIVAALVVLLAPRLTRRMTQRALADWSTQYRRMFSDSLDSIQGMTTLKAFNAHHRREAEMRAQGDEFADASIKLMGIATVYEGALGIATAVGTTVAVVVGSFRLVDGALDAAGLLLVLMLTRECLRPLTELQKAFHGSYGAPAAAGRSSPCWTLPSRCRRACRRPARSCRTATATDGDGPPGFAFADVTFRYRHGDRPRSTRSRSTWRRARPWRWSAARVRQVDGSAAAVAFHRPRGRPRHARRRRRQSAAASRAAPAGGRRRAGDVPLPRHGAQQPARRSIRRRRRDARRTEAANAAEFVERLPAGLDTEIGEAA